MLTAHPDPSPTCEGVSGPPPVTLRRFTAGLDMSDTLALCLLGLVTVSLLPGFFHPINIRHAIAFAAVPVGGWLLARQACVRRDPAAMLGLAFVTVTLLSAAAFDRPMRSISRDAGDALSAAKRWAAQWPNDPIAHQYVELTASEAGDRVAELAARERWCEITRDCGDVDDE